MALKFLNNGYFAGKVGIGTESPSSKLSIYDSAFSDTAGTGIIELGTGSTKYWNFRLASTAAADLVIDRTYSGTSSEVFRVQRSTGNVGIGTSSPGSKLTVNETSTATAALNIVTARYGISLQGAGTSNTQYLLNLQSNGGSTDVMRVQSSGNVGIGTTSPLGRLQVNEYTVASQGNQGVHGEVSVFANNGDESLFLGLRNSAYPNRGWALNPVAYGINSSLQIKEHGSTAVRMTIQSGGNVGIGTTAPLHNLQIGNAGTNGSYSMMIEGNFANTALSSNPRLNLIDTNFGITAGKYGSGGADDAIGIFAFQGAGRGILFAHTTAGSGTTLQNMRHDMFVDGGTGNVGIGTTSPTTKLQVSGKSFFQDDIFTLQNKGIFFNGLDDFSSGIAGIDSGTSVRIFAGGSEKVRVKSSGNVGIGTTSPTQKLHVVGNARVTGAYYDSNNSPGIANQVLISTVTGTDWVDGSAIPGVPGGSGTVNTIPLWTPDGDTLGNSIITQPSTSTVDVDGNILISDTGNDKYFGSNVNLILNADADANSGDSARNIIFQNRGSEKMRIDSSGNVGIGISNPVSYGKFVVQGTGNLINANASSGAATFQLYEGGQGRFAITTLNGSAGAKFELAGTEKMRIDSSGNVLIGIDTISASLGAFAQLEVSDSTKGGIIINTQQAGASNYGRLMFSINNNINGHEGLIRYNTSDYHMAFYTDGAEKMRIEESGNVGIGTTTPQQKLDVVGRVRASYNTSNYYEIGASSAGGFVVGKSGGVETVNIRTYGDSHFNGGNFGIGTSSPTAKLHVVGTGLFTGLVSGITPVAAANFVTKAYVDGSGGGTGPFLPLAGGTMTAGAVVTFLASSGSTDDRLKFGTTGQMQLFHDGSDGYIINSLGDVRMDVNTFRVRSSGGTETMIKATQNDSVELYYNNVRKLRTTTEGIFVEGQIKIDSALLDLQENTDVDTGTETVASVAIATYTAAFFDFVIKKTTNVRSGTVYACHDGTTVQFTETSTQDLGDTSDVTLSVDISGGNMRLRATTTSDNWSIKSLIRAI